MNYRPYSPEWSRKRYLKEALDRYIYDNVENEVIINDLLDILFSESQEKFAAFEKANALAYAVRHTTK